MVPSERSPSPEGAPNADEPQGHFPAGAGVVQTIFAAAALLLLVTAQPLTATTYNVDRRTDNTVGICSPGLPNDCALRGAILAANAHAGDDIIMLPLAGTCTLSIVGLQEELGYTGDLDVLDGLTIVGLGPGRTVIDTAGIDRVFDVIAPGKRLTLRGLTVTGGAAITTFWGGGIRAEAGALTLETVEVSGNTAAAGGGGAIYSISNGADDDTRIIDSWVTGNSSGGSTIHVRTIVLSRSTVSGNTTTSNAPALAVYGGGSFVNSTVSGHVGPPAIAAVSIINNEVAISGCTFADNAGPELQLSSGGSVELTNTVIVGTCSGVDFPASIGGNLESPGHTCHLGSSDLDDVQGPIVSALRWSGGPTPVHRPLAGSPAIDQPLAAFTCPLRDQRQVDRPRDGDGSGGPECDIGAVELFGPGEIFVDDFGCGFTTAWSVVAP